MALPTYTLTWDGPTSPSVPSINGPVAFVLTRNDGAKLAAPSTITCTITLPDGTTSAVTLTAEGTALATSQRVSGIYTFTASGLYLIQAWTTVSTVTTSNVVHFLVNAPLVGTTLASKLGATRMWLKDTEEDDPTWSDAELTNYLILTDPAQLSASSGKPLMAAALAYDLLAGDESRQAQLQKIVVFTTDKRQLPQALRDAATNLRRLYPVYGGDSTLLTLNPVGGVAEGIGAVTYSYPVFTMNDPYDTTGRTDFSKV